MERKTAKHDQNTSHLHKSDCAVQPTKKKKRQHQAMTFPGIELYRTKSIEQSCVGADDNNDNNNDDITGNEIPCAVRC